MRAFERTANCGMGFCPDPAMANRGRLSETLLCTDLQSEYEGLPLAGHKILEEVMYASMPCGCVWLLLANVSKY